MTAAACPADGRESEDGPATARRERSPVAGGDGAPRRGRRLAGRPRPVIEAIRPQVEGGRYPAKASLGELVVVEADVFADGHDRLFVELTHFAGDHGPKESVAMVPLHDDRWRGAFAVEVLGRHHFSVRAGIDQFATWRHDVQARAAAGQDVAVELEVGAGLVKASAGQADPGDRRLLSALAEHWPGRPGGWSPRSTRRWPGTWRSPGRRGPHRHCSSFSRRRDWPG